MKRQQQRSPAAECVAKGNVAAVSVLTRIRVRNIKVLDSSNTEEYRE